MNQLAMIAAKLQVEVSNFISAIGYIVTTFMIVKLFFFLIFLSSPAVLSAQWMK